MKAPLYPPALRFAAPVEAPFTLGVETVSVQEAAASPAIRRLLVEAAPQLELILNAPQVRSHAGNWSLRSLVTLDLISADALAAVERGLQSLPVADRPVL